MVSRYYAVKELLENGINSLPITTEQLEAIIISKGFKIINYDVSCKKHAEILTGLGVLSLADRTKAFTYVSNQEKIVFIKIGVSANEKRLLLAHELGHISLGHLSDNAVVGYRSGGLIDEGQEDEANAFALEFLAPICILRKKHITAFEKISSITMLDEKRSRFISDEVRNYKKSTNIEFELCNRFEYSDKSKKLYDHKMMIHSEIILFFSIVAFLISYTMLTHNNNVTADLAELPVATFFFEISEYSDYVVITKSGEKFHRPDCRHISDKTNITQMTLDEAQNTGYIPCKDCFSEFYN